MNATMKVGCYSTLVWPHQLHDSIIMVLPKWHIVCCVEVDMFMTSYREDIRLIALIYIYVSRALWIILYMLAHYENWVNNTHAINRLW